MRRPGAGALVWIATALAAISIGLHAGPLPWRFAGDSGLPAPAIVAATADEGDPVSIEPILALAPFGRLAPAPAPETPVEETALGLTLHGVVIATDAARSSAIISSGEVPARSYQVGEVVAEAATLIEVQGDHVVIEVAGRRETLSFPEIRSATGRSGGDRGVAALRALVTGNGGAANAPAETPRNDPEAVIARYRERIQANPQTVLDGLGLEATAQGYRIGETASNGVRRAGLQPGDVVEKVNGQQVGNIERDRDLFDAVAASGRARIEVLRDGQRVVMSFPLR